MKNLIIFILIVCIAFLVRANSIQKRVLDSYFNLYVGKCQRGLMEMKVEQLEMYIDELESAHH